MILDSSETPEVDPDDPDPDCPPPPAKPGQLPRSPNIIHISPKKAKLVQEMNNSKVRKEKAQAELAETELELKKIELEESRGALLSTATARRMVEDVHIEWTQRLDLLTEEYTRKLDAMDINVALRERLRDAIEGLVVEFRERIAAGK